MKFIHVSDVHLGQQPDAGRHWSAARGEELWETFRKLIGVCNEERTDLLLIAGNLFHRQPLKREIKELNYLFSSLKQTKVVFIAGNCDYVTPNSYYSHYPWNENVFFLGTEQITSVYFKELGTRVHGCSCYNGESSDCRFGDMRPEGEGEIHILLAHGAFDMQMSVQNNRLGAAGFDYTALGHIRKPELAKDRKMAYSGSPEPCEPGDKGQHGYIIGEIREGMTQFRFVPFAVREYILLRVRVTPDISQSALEIRLKKILEQNGEQNIYQIIMEGRYDLDAPLDADRLYRLGLVVSVQDETIPDYDLESIYEEHKEDIIGIYIQEFLRDAMTRERKKALYSGLSALLAQMGREGAL